MITPSAAGILNGGCDCAGELGGGRAGGGLEGFAGLRRRGGEDSFEHLVNLRLIPVCL